MKGMKRRMGIAGLALLLFAGLCIIEENAVNSRPSQAVDQNSTSVYMLAGEFRAVFANLLWVKAEQYHHEFIERNPDWTQNKELLGLLELITTLDPTFVEAYADAAYIQADGCHDPRKAIATLRRGIAHNPKEWELYLITAIMRVRRFNDPTSALPYAIKAAIYARNEIDRERALKLLHTVRALARDRLQ